MKKNTTIKLLGIGGITTFLISITLPLLVVIIPFAVLLTFIPGVSDGVTPPKELVKKYQVAQQETFDDTKIYTDVTAIVICDYMKYNNQFYTIPDEQFKINSDLNVATKGTIINEDNNRNGILESSEDINKNGVLDTELKVSTNTQLPLGDYIQLRFPEVSDSQIRAYWQDIDFLYRYYQTIISLATIKYGLGVLHPPVLSPFVVTAGWHSEDEMHGAGAHHGIDFVYQGSDEATVIASYPGEVTEVVTTCPSPSNLNNPNDTNCPGGVNAELGNVIVIKSKFKNKTFYQYYGHTQPNNPYIKVGDTVQLGQPIGVMGSSGYSSGEHVHLAVKYNGEWINPTKYFQKGVIPDEFIVEGSNEPSN